MKEILRYISRTPVRLRLWHHRTRVQLKLAAWHVPDHIAAWAQSVRPSRLVLIGVLATAILLPTSLYLQERARRHELGRAYRNLSHDSTAEITTLRTTMGNLMAEQAELKHLLLDAGYAVHSDSELWVAMTATGYSSSVIETDDTPFITASNTRTRTGIVAMSRDMLRRYSPDAPFSFGDVVHISGIGDFVVEDSMNQRWRRRVDVWFPSRTAAFQFGRRRVIVRAPLADDELASYEYSLPVNLAGGPGASAP
jgi:3D (Asp-Asp-Asp) domain-containing protein